MYRLTVAGELTSDLVSSLGGTMSGCVDGTTTWTAHVRDQAELQGMLARLADLGLTLLTATAVDDASLPVGSDVAAGGHPTRSPEEEGS